MNNQVVSLYNVMLKNINMAQVNWNIVKIKINKNWQKHQYLQ